MIGFGFAIVATLAAFYVGIVSLLLGPSWRKASITIASISLLLAWGGAGIVAIREWNAASDNRIGALLILPLATLMSLPAMVALLPTRASAVSSTELGMVCAHCGYSLQGLHEARCPECGIPFSAEYLRPAPKLEPPQNPNDA